MKKSKLAICVMCLSFLLAVTKAHDADRIGDIQCLLVGSQMTSSQDSNQRTFGTIIVMYYLGRIGDDLPEADLEKLIATESAKLRIEELKISAERCRKMLVAKGQLLQRIGNNLKFRDQQQNETKPPP